MAGIAAEAVRLVVAHLKADTKHIAIEEIPALDPRQKRGYDLVWCLRDSRLSSKKRELKIEVKGDSHDSDCLLFELVSDNTTGMPGWFCTSQADLIYYCFPHPPKGKPFAYVFSLAEARDWFFAAVNYWDLPTAVGMTKFDNKAQRYYLTFSRRVAISQLITSVRGFHKVVL